MFRILIIILVLYVVTYIQAGISNKEAEEDVIVEIANGKVKAKIVSNETGHLLYYSFLGIPYAQPPVKNLRFEDPKPVKDWEDEVLEPREDVPKCAQVGMKNEISGDEDCLYLNVYTPHLPTTEDETLNPVMVFIHGGGFTEGSGDKELYGPDFLMTEEIVLVSFNYRLGILGFFSLKNETTKAVTGNAGLKDQLMVLTWVKNNIKAFGGDPDSVTLFGESAGAVSVHYHVLSDKSQGLFKKAIMQSGSALAPWANGYVNSGEALAKLLEKDTTDHKKMLEELRGLDTKEILRGQILLKEEYNQTWGSPVYPIVESTHSTAFISKAPYELITSGLYNNVTLIIGYNDAEGIAQDQKMRYIHGESQLINDFQDMIPSDLDIKFNSSTSKNLAKEIKNFYYSDAEPSIEDMVPYIKIHTDVRFAYPAYRTAMEHVKNSNNSIYFYRFSADTELNVYKRRDEAKKYEGASHCDELGYLFMTDLTPEFENISEAAYAAMQRMVKLWTSIARNEKPRIDDFEWTKISTKSLNYLDFTTDNNKMKTNPDEERINFWKKQYEKYFNSNAISLKASPILILMYVVVHLIC